MNISPRTVSLLQEEGWDVIRVSERLPVNAPDQEVMEFAREDGRVLITQDLDFSTLLALGGYGEPSLVTIRMSEAEPEAVAKRLLEIFPQIEEVLREGCAVTVKDFSVRVRRLPIR
jgi:predicted nuclease of predicted toxin-antitoxin system